MNNDLYYFNFLEDNCNYLINTAYAHKEHDGAFKNYIFNKGKVCFAKYEDEIIINGIVEDLGYLRSDGTWQESEDLIQRINGHISPRKDISSMEVELQISSLRNSDIGENVIGTKIDLTNSKSYNSGLSQISYYGFDQDENPFYMHIHKIECK